jgi:hypothetical protein
MAALQRLNREDPQQYPSGSVISTRVVLDIAARIAIRGTDAREAVWATLRGQFDPGDERALSVCVDTQFPVPTAEAAIEEVSDDDTVDIINVGSCPYCGRGFTYGRDLRCSACGYALPSKPGQIALQP